MYELLRKNLLRKITLTEEEWEKIVEKTEFIKLKKNQFLQIQDCNCKYEAFVLKGLFKVFIANENGSESVFSFVFDEEWICDIESYYHQKPSRFNVKALVDSELLVISKANKAQLFKEIPQLLQFHIFLVENTTINIQQRLIDVLNKTTKQRYLDFVNKYPHNTHKINNKNLSSYLGVSHEFLSKIKKTF
ncbi:Crp/Fnr family transcriptional regulator [Flavobacterium agrisoli]|uniref:Crp/Fnr family transcriptional regulator n=1 Tax=Flavobacterium agrisoli TaxID=2793066 RepID=A0A934PLM7_9FLAO|nr:Crp/Fnr family transcriptional regulator [Flavobacterium agrisoli]MBK0369065.1 Crp/Fnr family transcriptional regulator [Flavobacterium agrisoli]